ncbi:MAG TPA: PilZ domain-containing protein [Syntrophobacteraceae bacterium]|nr:PilZ domain-containing protein [Syntrophobacteraceae bacterium]
MQERRTEPRFEFTSIVLPFLGSRVEDHLCFEYIPLDISTHGLKLAIPRWVVSRERLRDGDEVNLHVPFRLREGNFSRGRIVWSRWDDVHQGQVCGVRMEKAGHRHCRVFFDLDTREFGIDLKQFASPEDLALKVLKDSILLKRGVLIYLNHLVPYFSRVTPYPTDEYPLLKSLFLDDVKRKIEENIQKLEALHRKALEELPSGTEIPVFLDLEELRSLMESEIYLDLFKITFSTEAVLPLLSAIKELEERQYVNYNTLVMLYIRSL